MAATAERLCGRAALHSDLEPYALPILRVAMGLILIPHGCPKRFGWFRGLGFEGFNFAYTI